MSRWWLSFCDTDRPDGEQFLGCVFVEAADEFSAVRVSWALGINPGVEVMIQGPLEPAKIAALSFDLSAYYDRFVPRDEAIELTQRISDETSS